MDRWAGGKMALPTFSTLYRPLLYSSSDLSAPSSSCAVAGAAVVPRFIAVVCFALTMVFPLASCVLSNNYLSAVLF